MDWCEDHKIETIRSNVLGTLNLVDVAHECGQIHVTNFATGCAFLQIKNLYLCKVVFISMMLNTQWAQGKVLLN